MNWILIHQENEKNNIDALSSLLKENGLDASDFIGVVQALGAIKQREQEEHVQKKQPVKNKVIDDKEYIFPTREFFLIEINKNCSHGHQ